MSQIIITGNPVDGHGFIGPFVSSEDASTWANHVDLEPDWWVAELTSATEAAFGHWPPPRFELVPEDFAEFDN